MRFVWDNIVNSFTNRGREKKEEQGLIPIVAAHDGFIVSSHNDDYDEGIYSLLESECGNYRTLYFHLDKLRVWRDDEHVSGWEKINGLNFVKAGTVLGWGGNSGRYTTGAHLHFELREKLKDGTWRKIDPMPFLQDSVVYQRYYGFSSSRWFYKGKEITREQVNLIT